jgi:hypothetical protein
MWKTHEKRVELRNFAPTQREILKEVLLVAAESDMWLTLEELARVTKYPPASISAQLRHLRKPEFGGYVVEKRRCEVEEVQRPTKRERVWEYQMRRAVWLVGGAEIPAAEVLEKAAEIAK